VIPVIATLRERFGIGLQDITGATVRGELPVSEAAVNRLVAARLANHPQIESVQLRAEDGDAITVMVTLRSRLIPSIPIRVRVDAQPDFPDRPVLVLRWTMPGLGPLAMFAGPLLAFFKKLPQGIRSDGDRVAVDLRDLLQGRGLGDVAALIRGAAVHTHKGGFVVRFELGA
jgi:hypothetical protein